MKNLVIVESPTKARTISRFLGKDYDIKFSMGHIIDLPKSKLGIDIENNFAPQYEVIEDKKKLISELKAAAKKADTILLATDPDREGEAISANIKEILTDKVSKNKFKRIVFHEITEGAIKDALTHPREVDENLVGAQTARRILDRLVGYQLSPVLWKKVRRGLSAGRVQSVALRFLVEREREIEKFGKEPYFTIHAVLLGESEKRETERLPVEFALIAIKGEKIEVKKTLQLYDGDYTYAKTTIDTQEKANQIVNALQKQPFSVIDVSKRRIKRSPYPPFTTSTLQQQAAQRFGLPGKRTMSLAQKLYEEGYITYHRTDSVIISQVALTQIRTFVQKEYGNQYIPEAPRAYFTKQKNAQEAHEAIRPTQITRSTDHVKGELGDSYAKLYDLIWRRAVASQMSDALVESTTVYADTNDNNYRFKANGSVLLFDGFLKLTPQALEDARLPNFTNGESLSLVNTRADAHETTPPPRYNDASLIKTLEEKEIGRPSTYASIISTITDRGYVERVERKFLPTAVGIAVNDFLVKNFSTIDDIPFTAAMEDELDAIANGLKDWKSMMRDFYTPFEKTIVQVENAERVKIPVEETGEICPQCHKGNLVVRTGRFGKFFSCSTFPDCNFTKPFVEETNILCPKDGGKVIIKKTRKGRKFYGCSNYPNCDFAAWKLEDIKTSGTTDVKKRAAGVRIKATKKRNMAKGVVRKIPQK
ncbi:MAG TPA: type I DNA topoisomerase [Candidatus Sulfotelmatobacter sp.]|jgi:DNA topoisomerase-1|nr:type I DNA topoisomerase [Candidatus Sulfotelmatobacter sp.]